jgi:hypothetical protein
VNLSFTGPTFAYRKKLNCVPLEQTA